MKRIFPFFVVSLVLLSGVSMASPMEYYESTIKLNSSEADYTFTFLFQESPTGTLDYLLPFNIEDFKTSANFKNYTCEAKRKDWGTLISCDFSHAGEEGRALSIRFRRTNCIKKIDNIFHFETSIKTPQEVPRIVSKVILDKGFILIPEPTQPTTLVPFTPNDGTEGSDGRRIFVVWERKNLKKGEGLDISVSYERSVPVTTQDNLIFLFLGVAILIVLLILALRFKGEKREIESILKEDERKVVEIIKGHGGMCKQREIVRETDFSKAKVSRLIRDLEERRVIKIEKSGRTNEIYLLNKTPST